MTMMIIVTTTKNMYHTNKSAMTFLGTVTKVEATTAVYRPNTTNIFYIQPKSFAMHIVKASYFQSKQIRKTYLNMLQMQHTAAFVDELVFRLQCHDE